MGAQESRCVSDAEQLAHRAFVGGSEVEFLEIIDGVFYELRAKQLDIYKESFAGNTTLETCMMAVEEHLTDADGRGTRNDLVEYNEDDQIEPVS